jgi:hypothetical protein
MGEALTRCVVATGQRSAFPLLMNSFGTLVVEEANRKVFRALLERTREAMSPGVQVRAVFLDNLARLLVAASENDAGPVLQVFDIVKEEIERVFPGAGIVWIAHPPKSNESAVRGSGAIFGALRGAITMQNCHSMTGEMDAYARKVLTGIGLNTDETTATEHRIIRHWKSNFSARLTKPIVVRRHEGTLIDVLRVIGTARVQERGANAEAILAWMQSANRLETEWTAFTLEFEMGARTGRGVSLQLPHPLGEAAREALPALLEWMHETGLLTIRTQGRGNSVSRYYRPAGPTPTSALI